MSGVRRLPIRVPPQAGEALDSWLEAVAHRTSTTFVELLAAVGLNFDRQPGANPWMLQLAPEEVAAISAATGVPSSTVSAMTTAHRTDSPGSNTFYLNRKRRGMGSSRYCPACLEESGGRWQLSWRLRWNFACIKHKCLLVDTCPSCGKTQRVRWFPAELIPSPGLCARQSPDAAGRLAPRCGADLRVAATTRFEDDHPTLLAQAAIHAAADQGFATCGIYREQPVSVDEFCADLRALGARALSPTNAVHLGALIPVGLQAAYHAADLLPRVGLAQLAITNAVGLTAAMSMLGNDEIGSAATLLARLEKPTQRNGASLDWPTAGWARGTTAAVTALRLTARASQLTPVAQLRYRIGTPRPGIPTLSESESFALAAKLPATLWEPWAVRLRVPQLGNARLAPSLACILLLVNSRISPAQAQKALEPVGSSRTIPHHLRGLAREAHWVPIRTALIRLADDLHNNDSPINYERRRSLDYSALLPVEVWEQICADLDMQASGPARLQFVRCHLYECISGNPGYLAPWFLDTNSFTGALFRLPTALTPALLTMLNDYATTFLQGNNIHEPTTWHPPLTLLGDLNLPGTDPDRLPLTRIHRMVRQGHCVTAIAEHLQTTPDAIRHVLTIRPAPAGPGWSTSKRLPQLSQLASELSGDELRDLYETQRLSLRQIAGRYGTQRRVVAQLARRNGITLRPSLRPPRHSEIDRDWLHTEYVVRRRTLPELAAEKGMSTANMSRWARHHQIPRRGRGGPSHAATISAAQVAETAPALLHPALTGIGGMERLNRFAIASSHPTCTAAAAAMGIENSILTTQIKRLGEEFGGPLITRAYRNHPMTTTDLGAQVLRAWKKWAGKIESDPPRV